MFWGAPSSGDNSLSSREQSPNGFADSWTFEEQKAFEIALAMHYDKNDRWEHIASCLPNKSLHDIHAYYLSLEDDVRRIDAGAVALPAWACEPIAPPPPPFSRRFADSKQGPSPKKNKLSHGDSKSLLQPPQPPAPLVPLSAGGEKRKGVPWTEEEHKLFLLGLAKFGKGDWRSIARHFVMSRTPTQVASHAQKYFIRLNCVNKKDKRRASIHDITCASLPELHAHLHVGAL